MLILPQCHCERSPAPHGVQGEVKQSPRLPRRYAPRNDDFSWSFTIGRVIRDLFVNRHESRLPAVGRDTEHDLWDGRFFLLVGFWNRKSRNGRNFGEA